MRLKSEWILIFLCSIMTACADSGFMDKTKIDGSILRGTELEVQDPLNNRTVFIAKNYIQDASDSTIFEKFGICTGVVLTNRYILTAAHCANSFKTSRVIFTDDANNLKLVSNSILRITDIRIPGTYYFTKANEDQLKVAPGPDNTSNLSDLAVLQLERESSLGVYEPSWLTQANILSLTDKKSNIGAEVLGYGRISEYNNTMQDPFVVKNNMLQLNGKLLKAKIKISASSLKQRLLIHDQRVASGVCGGDSGAPLFIPYANSYYLQAIAIATYKVKDEDPTNMYNSCYGNSVFLNLDFHKEWINHAIEDMEINRLKEKKSE